MREKTFRAKTLQQAILQACDDFSCEVEDLDFKVLQEPRKGFFFTGIGRKDAIILARLKKLQSPKNLRRDIETDCLEIQRELVLMLSYLPYKIDTIEVSAYDRSTVKIFLDGEDNGLLIGTKGCRYNAFSYLLFSWIYPKYGYNVRLEIAQFLQLQERIVEEYLRSIAEDIESGREFTTKNLGKILSYIALRRIRELYPGRYVVLRGKGADTHIYIGGIHE